MARAPVFRRMLAQRLTLFILGFMSLASAACREPVDSVAEPLVVANYSDILTLDPHLKNEFLTQSVLSNLFEGLAEFDHELRVEPSLAVSWSNPDDLTWQFKLRPGVRFHDGSDFDAGDVVFSLERAQSHPASDYRNYLISVVRIAAVDELTVEITTVQPNALLLNKLCSVMIVPEGSPEVIEKPIGTGPYVFRHYSREEKLSLDAFGEHWSGEPDIPAVDFVTVTDSKARASQLLAGTVDFVMELDSADLERIEEAPGVKVSKREGLIVEYLGFRIDRAPFSDPRLRKAVHLALDRQNLVATMMDGQAVPATQLVGRQVFGFASSIEAVEPDLESARQLVAEAGFGNGLELELEHRSGRDAGPIADQLAHIGIRITPRQRPWSEMFERLKAGEVSFYYGGTISFSGDASDFFDSKIHSANPADGYGDSNFSGYADTELDTLIEDSIKVVNMLQRRAILEEAMQRVMQDLPVVPLVIPFDLFGLDEDLAWTPRADGKLMVATIKRRTYSE